MASYTGGKLDDAKNQIDKAIVNDKQSGKSKTWFYRGEIYRGIAADPTGVYTKLDTNAVQVAYEAYKKAQELEPGSTFAKQAAEKQAELMGVAINQGAAKFQANDYPGAARAFEMARQLNPKDTTAALYAAYSYINMQDKELYPKAIDALQVMVDNNSPNPANYVTLIDLLQATEQVDRAIAVSNTAIERFPDKKDIRDKQFNLYISGNKTDEAKANLLEAVKREPNNATYLKNLGILYDQSGEKEKAVEYYEKALAVDPTSYDANFNLGVLHYNKGADLSKKIRDMDLKQYQKDGKRLEGEAKVHFKKALPYFESNYKANPKDANVLEPLKSIYAVLERKADSERVDKELQALSK
jgi:tetratricopeptide (TPR) repeat protein